MKLNRRETLNFLGWFLIIFAVSNMIVKIYYGFVDEFFWLCNNVPIIVGLGILIRQQKIVLGIFSLLFVGSLFWNIGTIYLFSTGSFLFGIADYIGDINSVLKFFTITNHFFTFVFSIIAIILLKKQEKFAWFYGLIYGLILAIPAFFIPSQNYNCMIAPCLDFIPQFSFYTVAFFVVYLLAFMIPFNYLMNWINKKIWKS